MFTAGGASTTTLTRRCRTSTRWTTISPSNVSKCSVPFSFSVTTSGIPSPPCMVSRPVPPAAVRKQAASCGAGNKLLVTPVIVMPAGICSVGVGFQKRSDVQVVGIPYRVTGSVSDLVNRNPGMHHLAVVFLGRETVCRLRRVNAMPAAAFALRANRFLSATFFLGA